MSLANKDKNKKLIEENWIVVGFDACGYTKKAIKLLVSKNINFMYIPISPEKGNESNIRFFEKKLKPIARKINPEHKTYPFVFDKGTFVGGFSDLENYLEGKQIQKMKSEKIFHYHNKLVENFLDKYTPKETQNNYDDDEDDDGDDQEFKIRMKKFLSDRE